MKTKMEMLKRDKNMANKTDGIYNMNYKVYSESVNDEVTKY